MSEWENLSEDDFIEILKFDDPLNGEHLMYNEEVKSVYVQPNWNSLEKFTNLWGKQRYRLKVYKIKVYPEGMNRDDQVNIETIYYLDVGKRLLKALREHAPKKPKYLKLLRIGEGFETTYYAKIYKLYKQKSLPVKKTTKKSS